MRYQNEIEEILKISEEFGSKILNKYYVLQAIYGEGIWKNNDLASLGHKLANMSTLFKQRNEIVRVIQDLLKREKNLNSKFSNFAASEKTLWAEVQKAIVPNVEESATLLEIDSHKFKWLKEEVESILMTSGHYDPADLDPYLEKDNQDQLIMLKIILRFLHPNGRSHCNDPKITETEAPKNDMITVDLKTQDTQLNPNMPLDSKVIETEAPKNGMITVDLKTQDTQLNPNMSPDFNVIKTEAPKNDMITVGLKTQDTQLNPKPNPMPKKIMTPRYKCKRIKKGGKVQKIQFPRFHKMKFKPSQKITDSQNIPIKPPNISCDSTVLDTGIPKSDSSKMGLEVQDTKYIM